MNCNCSHSNEFHLVKMIHNELGVWRNAIETIEPDLAFLDSEQTNSQGPIQSTTLRLSSASYNNNNDAQQHHSQSKTSSNLYLSPALSPVSSYENGQHHFIPDQSGNNPLTNDVEYLHPRSFVDDRPSMCSMYSPSSSPSLLSSSPCSPAGSNHSIPISSIHSNYGPNTQCSFVHVPFIHQHNNNQFPQQQQQHPDQQSQFNSRISFGNNNPISYAESDFFDFSNNNFLQRQIQETPINTVRNHCLYSDCGSDGGGNFSDDDLMNEESEDFWKNPCKTDRSVSYSSTMRKFHDRTSSHQDPFSLHSIESSSMTRNNGSSSSSIQLWQFLKELLSQPQKHGTAIRWIERSSGVFKIEDSVRVARLWGERKNRPAMNYDKLSRSIRQYYKKGIMKKTERAQRLVYQFCKPYSL
ncbi:DNA-binding protein D-ETS-4 [Sarcoptes scabiei]|uniref:DNA-binding protein D-ETS-4 n=2 Tax=Sarcoptes scabiei TaxID=52283 RepID=A0A834RFN9_SARSC|nr:DNA-binding protein D-ETS-4 [Sarcoptes scabiei]